MRELPFAVLVILDVEAAARAGRSVVEQGLSALDAQSASIAAFLVRMKDRPASESANVVRALRPACSARRAPLLVHTFLDVARDEGADGLHLAASADPRAARAALGASALVGWSRHAGCALDDARVAHCTYVTVSPFARPLSKEDARAPVGEVAFAALVRDARAPVVALGGIHPGLAPIARRAGAAGIAVLGWVSESAHPASALDALVDAFVRTDADA